MAGERLSISPSKIEQFRKFYTEAMNGWVTEEKVIESIKGESVWSNKMVDGTAYHKVIEYGPEAFAKGGKFIVPVDDEVKGHPDIIFHEFQVTAAREYRALYPGAIFEVPNRYVFSFMGYTIEMNMFMDSMWGNEVHDHKVTEKDLDVNAYEDSMQWQIYLLSTGAERFRYNLFKVKRKDEEILSITWNSFYLVPRQDMEQKLREWMFLYIQFCKDRDLMQYLIKK